MSDSLICFRSSTHLFIIVHVLKQIKHKNVHFLEVVESEQKIVGCFVCFMNYLNRCAQKKVSNQGGLLMRWTLAAEL